MVFYVASPGGVTGWLKQPAVPLQAVTCCTAAPTALSPVAHTNPQLSTRLQAAVPLFTRQMSIDR